MFKDLINTIQRLDGLRVSIQISADKNGYIDKQCPSDKCEFLFKVNEDDWSDIFRDEAVWCPMCRHQAPADDWFTIEQIEHAKSEAAALAHGHVDKALRSGARKFNRSQGRDSLISMSMEVHGAPRRTYTLPAAAVDVMQLEIQCDSCSARFAVIGSAYFCPACGANSVIRTYNDSLRKIRAKMNCEQTVRDALIEANGKDDAELTCRSLRETCLTDGVTAFQKYCEGLYEPYGDSSFNIFQRVDDGSGLWRSAIGCGYDAWLTEEELESFKVLFQKRHLLAHNEGIVDQRYIENSGDTTYRAGQRLVITKRDIETLLILLEKLGDGLSTTCSSPT